MLFFLLFFETTCYFPHQKDYFVAIVNSIVLSYRLAKNCQSSDN